eukprot:1818903-Pyramimonas_sp.AAC.1
MCRSRRYIVRSDNMMVVEAAAGGVMYRSCGALPALLDSLVQLARVRTVANTAHPLDELVDALACLASTKDISDRPKHGAFVCTTLPHGQGSMVLVDSRRPP